MQGEPVSTKELGVTIVDGGTILPSIKSPVPQQVWGLGGVVDSDGEFVKESASGAYEIKIFGGKYDYSADEVEEYDEEVMFLGPVTSHWGSFLVDQTARLWYVVSKEFKGRIAYCGVNYAPNTFGGIDRPAREFFELLGVTSDRLIDIRKPSKFRKVIIPELSFVQGKFISKPYKDIFGYISNNVSENDWPVYDKLYLTRTAIKKRKEAGEEAIERLFALNGYKVLSMERLSVAEQVHYMKLCKVVASIDGTVAHNILFSQNCEEQIVLEKQSRINPYQHLFNELMGVPLDYVDVYKEPYKGYPVNHDDGPFYVYVSKKLISYLKDHDMNIGSDKYGWINFTNMLKYTKMCLYIGVVKPTLMPVYHFLRSWGRC